MGIMKGVKDFLGSIFRGKRSYASSLEVVLEELGTSTFERIFLACKDRRSVPKLAAQFLGTSEELLVERVASKMKLPFLSSIPKFSERLIPTGTSVDDLREAGACIVCAEEKLIGLVCVDPLMVKKILFERGKIYTSIPIMLAPWSAIGGALDSCSSIEEEEDDDEQPDIVASAVAEGAMVDLIKKGKSVDARSIKLNFGIGVATAFFNCSGGKTGRADIRDDIIPALRHLVSQRESFQVFLTKEAGGLCEAEFHKNSEQEYVEIFLTGKPKLDSSAIGEITFNSDRDSQAQTKLSLVNGGRAVAVEKIERTVGADSWIMLVEDSPSFSFVVERFLRQDGYNVKHSKSVSEALTRLESEGTLPAAIVLDLGIPGGGGEAVLEALRASERTSAIPVIVLTSDERNATEVRILEGGADAFIKKSSDPGVLRAHIKRILQPTRAICSS